MLVCEGSNVVATLHLGNNRQFLLQRPVQTPTRHTAKQLWAADRLQTHSSAGVQCARKAVVFHTNQRLPQSLVDARWAENSAYGLPGAGYQIPVAFH